MSFLGSPLSCLIANWHERIAFNSMNDAAIVYIFLKKQNPTKS